VGILKTSQLQLDPTGFANLTSQFPGATINNTLAIASGTNFKLRSSGGVEFVVHLPIINAPFRLYWAYNFTRLSQQIVAPPSIFNIPDSVRQGLPPGVYALQILPQISALQANSQRINYFEALRTLRFTVSRTF
jgi:outer membrane protein insertion porin family